MNFQLIDKIIVENCPNDVKMLLNDRDSTFLVDWREEDDAIIEYCESIIQTGDLAAEIIETDEVPGFELYIIRNGTRTRVSLEIGLGDRHITLIALNKCIAPEYEIRLCVGSIGGDTLGFLPLAIEKWQQLESRHGIKNVAKEFYKIMERPNVFTESIDA